MKASVVDALAVCSAKETCREDVLQQLPNVQRRDVQDSWQEYPLYLHLSGSKKSCCVRHALEKGTCTLYPTIVAAIYKRPQQVGLTRCWPVVWFSKRSSMEWWQRMRLLWTHSLCPLRRLQWVVDSVLKERLKEPGWWGQSVMLYWICSGSWHMEQNNVLQHSQPYFNASLHHSTAVERVRRSWSLAQWGSAPGWAAMKATE